MNFSHFYIKERRYSYEVVIFTSSLPRLNSKASVGLAGKYSEKSSVSISEKYFKFGFINNYSTGCVNYSLVIKTINFKIGVKQIF